MKKFIPYIALAVIWMIGGEVHAQQIPVFTQYLFNPYLYNPARAGGEDLGHLNLGHKRQWTNMPEAPSTSILTFDYPIVNGNSGVGVTFFTDQVHLIDKVGGSFSYAYHIKFDETLNFEHSLSLGLSAGFLNQRIDFSNATVKDPNDDALLNRTQSSTAFDVGFGAHYRYKRLNIDVSVPQLSNANVRYLTDGGQGTSSFELVSHFLASAAYSIPLNKKTAPEQQVELEPVLMVRGAKGLPIQYDANLLLKLYERLVVGVGYRSGGNDVFASSLNASIGVKVQEMMRFSYTYEIAANSANRTSLGNTHEFSLGFMFGGTSKKVDDLERRLDEWDEMGNAGQMKADSLAAANKALEEEKAKNAQLIAVPYMQQDSRSQLLDDYLLLMILRELKEMKGEGSNGNRGNSRSSIQGQNGGEDRDFEKVGSVYFDYDSSVLTEEGKKELRRIRDVLQGRSDIVVIYTAGNASLEGASDYNMVLSTRRAVAVKNYLAQLGISETRVLPLPYGAENPITQEQVTEEQREMNRRVDVYLLENK